MSPTPAVQEGTGSIARFCAAPCTFLSHISIPGRNSEGNFPLLHRIQTGTGAQSASYAMDTGARAVDSPPCNAEI
jgi:hypothetical protein